MWHTGRHMFLHPEMTLFFIVWTGSLLLRLHYCHTINILSSFSTAAWVMVKMIVGREDLVKGMRSRQQQRKVFHHASPNRTVEGSVAHGAHGRGIIYHIQNYIMADTHTLMCTLIISRLKVLHDKWIFQTRHSAFKLSVGLEARGAIFTALNSVNVTVFHLIGSLTSC